MGKLTLILAMLAGMANAQYYPPSGGGSSGSGGSSGQYSTASATYTAGTYYFPAGGGLAASATQSKVYTYQGAAGAISAFSASVGAPGSATLTFTWYDGATGETTTCAVTSTATNCQDAVHTFPYLKGDPLTIGMVVSGATYTGTVSMVWGTGQAGPAPSGTPNQVVATNASGSSSAAAALRALVPLDIPANVRARAIGWGFNGGGSALTTSAPIGYVTVPFACTITGWDVTVDTGTATFYVWKVASGTAVPTSANNLISSATYYPAIATGTAIHSTTLTDWTTSVSAFDVFAFSVGAVSGATVATLVLECGQ